MNTKFKRFILTAVSSLLLLALAACTAADVAPEGIKDALTSSSADGDDNSSPSVNYTDTSLSTNPLILSATGEMYYNPVIGPESFNQRGAYGEGYGSSGIADPFVMRYNGTYYLYCTTPSDTRNGVKCFSSTDLVNWKVEGACSRWVDLGNGNGFTDYFCTDETYGAYAPEVIYYPNNGKFYMYTAAVTGKHIERYENGNPIYSYHHAYHAVLEADSPTGPFHTINGNLEGYPDSTDASIDGHVFIDDTGKLYFYWAEWDDKEGEGAVWGCEMYSPTSLNLGTKQKIIVMNAGGDGTQSTWTEGPFVLKHNGKYYLTYTGNHCWSEGYRINYAVSDNPLGTYKEMGDNPLIVHQTGFLSDESHAWNSEQGSFELYDGVGHSSTVLGPNLDSYYIVYHALHRGFTQRNTRIDRLAFDGDYMYTLGTTTSAAMPQMPHLYNYFNSNDNGEYSYSDKWDLSSGGKVTVPGNTPRVGITLHEGTNILSKEYFGYSYTAECNFLYLNNGGRAGVYFNYDNANNYGKAIFDRDNDTLTVTFVVDGKSTDYTKSLKDQFGDTLNFGACQTLTVKRDGNEFTFLVNNQEVCSYNSSLGRGRFGPYAEKSYVKVGFTAINPEVNGSSIKSDFKPVTSDKILATDCKGTDYETISNDGQDAVVVTNDDILNYYISVEIADSGNFDHVSKAGAHDILFRYISYGNTTITVYQNKKKIGKFTLPDTGGVAKTEIIRNAFSLTDGCSVLTFCFDTERFIFSDFELDRYEAVQEVNNLNGNWDINSIDGLYSDGEWNNNPGWDCWARLASGIAANYAGKKMFGSYNYGDYEVEVHIRNTTGGGKNSGLIVRGSNPSSQREGSPDSDVNKSALRGTNFYQGYFAYLDNGVVYLGKANYNWTLLASNTAPNVPYEEYYRLKVRVKGANIQVYVNEVLYIDYTDPYPFMQGAFGIRTFKTNADFVKLSVKPI